MDGDVLEAHYTKGNALVALKEYENAAGHFSEALKIDPNHFDTLVNFSDALLKSGKYMDALDLCNRAIKIDPLSSKIPYNNRGAANRVIYDPTASDAEIKISGIEVTGISFKQS